MRKLLLFFALIVILAVPVYGAPPREHGIAEYIIYIHINRDGSAQVEERVVNRFTGQFNGVFLEVEHRGFGDLIDFSVLEYLPATGEYIYFTQVQRADIGDDGVFTASGRGGTYTFQVFRPSQDEYRTIVYRYTLTQGATRFLDTGQLYRTLLKDWDMAIESHHIIVTFEEAETAYLQQSYVNARITVDGSLVSSITSNNVDTLSDTPLLPGQTLGVNILFPEAWLPYAPITNREVNARPFQWLWVALAGILAIITIPIAVVVRLARPHKVDFNERYYHMLPADNGPALMAYLVRDKQLKIKDVLATLLNMAKDGILTISRDAQMPEEYRFTREPGFKRNLRPHEEFLHEWLFEGIGNGTSVGLKEIKLVGENEDTAMLFHEKFNMWTEIVKAEADEKNYFESYWRRSPHGELEHRQWRAFKRYLKDLTDIDENEMGAHAFWDKYLPYALSLGSAKKLMKRLPDIPRPVGLDDWDATNMVWFTLVGPQMLGLCTGTFSSTYSYGLSYATSHGDGGLGSYSVSSSGGGGSSGGAF